MATTFTITTAQAVKQFFISIDQTFNTIIKIADDGYGYADEMLSARAWRLRGKSRLYIWIDRLFFFLGR